MVKFSQRKGVNYVNRFAENVALLHLLNQDTKSLTIGELYELYAQAVKDAEAYAKQADREKNGPSFSIN